MTFKHLLLASLVMVGLSGCTSTQLASDWFKKTTNYGQDDSNFSRSSSANTISSFKVGRPYKVAGVWYTPKESYTYDETGIASWYGPDFHGKKTANGETYDMYALTAAHPTLQMPALVRVTNLENGKSIVLRINDRGPFKRGRIIDISKKGAQLLGFHSNGTARVRVQVLPTESRAIANAAKAGRTTSLQSLASVDNTPVDPAPVYEEPIQLQPQQQAVQQEELLTAAAPADPEPTQIAPVSQQPVLAQSTPVAGENDHGRFMPAPVVEQVAVQPTNIYVQVGSFTNPENAQRLIQRLSHYENIGIYQAHVNDQSYNRVRVGPIHEVLEADSILDRLVTEGYTTAHIVVDK